MSENNGTATAVGVTATYGLFFILYVIFGVL